MAKFVVPKVFDRSMKPRGPVKISLQVQGLKNWPKGVMLFVKVRGRLIEIVPVE